MSKTNSALLRNTGANAALNAYSAVTSSGIFSLALRFLVISMGTLISLSAATQPENKMPTSTRVGSNLNPSPFGQLLTFTASVTSDRGSPAGSISFKDGPKTLGGGTLDRSGQAHLSIPWIPSGVHLVGAVYEGDTDFAPSKSSILRQIIKRATTNITLTSSPGQSTVGQTVTFRATVSSPAATPTGVIEFKDGDKSLGIVPLNEFLQGTLSTSKLAAGTHMVTAAYSGNENFAASRSNLLRQTINHLKVPSGTSQFSSPRSHW